MLGDMKRFRHSMGFYASYHLVREGMIEMCIAGGIGEADDILYLVKQLKVRPEEALDTLRKYEGDDPTLYRWKRDAVGRYRLHVQRAFQHIRDETPRADEWF
ncbi:hypothetical protein SPHINGO8AM_240007 [Sphingomonas sp. 8AM]|nr:hypothetical protein SPHINGO8AM_240007 [Sphingomonas sp. 8AM]